jgi:two-component system cell cycle sensor histidine kinase/response regulator CckA
MTKKGKRPADPVPSTTATGSPQSGPEAALRRRAEAISPGNAALSPANLKALPAEEIGRVLHELRVHQIELEMQNEELRRAQEELEASRAKYFDLFDLAPAGYFTVGEKGLILEANLTAANLLGVERQRFAGQLLTRFITAGDEDIYYLGRKRLIETGAPQACELRMRRQDGSRVWARLDMRIAQDGGDGAPVCRISLHDITGRKHDEDALRASEERLRAILDNAPAMIFMKDTEGRYLLVNRLFEETFQVVNDEILGKTDHDIFPKEIADVFVRSDQLVVRSGQPVRMEEVAPDGDGVHTYISVKFPLRAGTGGTYAVCGIATDITDRKLAEEEKLSLERQVQQAQKMESLGVLAGGIAHDFNNLLMVVLGHAELALGAISPMSPVRSSLTEISTAARRAADLSQQMLAYSGKALFALERMDVRELVEEMAHLLQAAISKKAVLTLNLERGLPPILGDPSQIRQIVMNLIINASEAIGDRDGVIRVAVGTTRCDEEYLQKTELHDGPAPGLYVHLEVTDTGIGMDAKTRSRIFEPFFSTKFTGRGLGLAAVLGIVRAHKGALKVYSEPGKGTTFKVLFPSPEEVGEGARTNDSSAFVDWRGQGTILLVDDEETLLRLGARMLEHLGFTVLTAADGRQAVDLYREKGKEIDLVLMDLTMPHMDGAEAFGELRRLNPDVRVVLSSGYAEEDVLSRFAGKKPAGVIQKPFTLARLRETLAGLMPERTGGAG